MNERTLLKVLKEKIKKEVPISAVIRSRIEVKQRNTALCPFHDDHSLGSFQFNDGRNIFKCFTCGAYGDAINFIEKFDKVDYKTAVYRIAIQFKLATVDELKPYFSDNNFAVKVKAVDYSKRSETKTAQKLNQEFTAQVYAMMTRICPLTQQHRDYLYKRGISLSDMNRVGYFSFTGKDLSKDLLNRFKPYGKQPLDFIGIPGFYMTEHDLKMTKLYGIGIPIRNYEGEIVAIQVRRDKVELGQQRYIFFSSANKPLGCSCGAPLDVIRPEKLKSNDVIVTEGKFKSESVANHVGCIVISLQGVGNLDCIADVVKAMMQDGSWKSNSRFIVAFDADMIVNPQVYNASVKLLKTVTEAGIPMDRCRYLWWDLRLAKGIDDLLQSKNPHSALCVDAKSFQNVTSKYYSYLEKNNIKPKDDENKSLEHFYKISGIKKGF